MNYYQKIHIGNYNQNIMIIFAQNRTWNMGLRNIMQKIAQNARKKGL